MLSRNPKLKESGWAPFESMDRLRRWQGEWAEALGWGPIESPSRILLAGPAMTLRAYGKVRDQGPVVLIVPAPIKRAYIWDLLPRASVVQQFARSGARVYLLQWERPGAAEQEFGLAEYADRLILRSLQAIEKEARGPVVLASHSLGGILASIFSALHPERVAGLILLEAPLHFGPEVDALSALVAESPPAPVSKAVLGSVPGSFLNAMSWLASPQTFAYSRWWDRLASLGDASALDMHLRVERWTRDEMPLPRRLFEELVEWLYREDRLMRGTLEIGGRRVAPELVEAPLLSVLETESAVVPPESVLPFHNAVRSQVKRVIWYTGDTGVVLQHLGVLVGRNAHQRLWPAIVRWTHEQAFLAGSI